MKPQSKPNTKKTISKQTRIKGKTDWQKLKKMTEQEIVIAAKDNPDAQPISLAELKKFTRVHSPDSINAHETSMQIIAK